MRILQITSHLNVGGISRYVLSLCHGLVQRRHDVILASDGGSLQHQAQQMGITYWPLPLHTSAEFSPQVFWASRQLAKYVQQQSVDIIHAHTRVAQVVADRVSRQLKIPYVTTWHGIYKRRVGRVLWQCTGEKTIAISGLVKEHLTKDFHLPEERIRRVYNGINGNHYATLPDSAILETCRKQWGISQDQPVIGGIGRLAAGRVKGFDSLLVATHLLKKRIPDIRLLIVGDGPRRPFLEDIARRLKVQDRVYFVGSVNDIRIPLALMDLFVFTSRWPEAFGLTVVEAMAAAKAVIATNVGAVPEIIQHGVNGWIVPPDDPMALADAIEQLLHDPDQMEKLAHQAQQHAQEFFNLERVTMEVEGVYREVANGS